VRNDVLRVRRNPRQLPGPALPAVEPAEEIRLAGTILSVVGHTLVVQVGLSTLRFCSTRLLC
jgi:hypothetical protein